MKKAFVIIALLAASLNLLAQSQVTVVRGETLEGKKIRVDYYKGSSKDLIEKIEYQVVDELQEKIKTLESQLSSCKESMKTYQGTETKDDETISNLNERINLMTRQMDSLQALLKIQKKDYAQKIDSLNKEYKKTTSELAKDENSTDLNELMDLKSQNERLGDSIDLLKRRMTDMKDMKVSEPQSVIGISARIGLSLFSNYSLDNDVWGNDLCLHENVTAYYEFKRIMKKFPLSVGIGLGYSNYKIGTHFATYSENIVGLTDADGDSYEARYRYSGIKEEVSLSYVSIPIFVSVGQPIRNRVCAYGKLSIVPSFNISKKFKGEGIYTKEGYYDKWNVVLHDIPELGFVTDNQCYDDVKLDDVNSFVLWGNLSGGVYIPCCNLAKRPYGSDFILKIGVSFDCSILPVSSKSENQLAEKSFYSVNTCNLLNTDNLMIYSPSIEVGIIYTVGGRNK